MKRKRSALSSQGDDEPPAKRPKIVPPPHVANMSHILTHVTSPTSPSRSLFWPLELRNTRSFLKLSLDPKNLLARMYCRHRATTWFHLTRLRSRYELDVEEAVAALTQQGLVEDFRSKKRGEMDLRNLLHTFTVNQLKEVAQGLGRRIGGRKAELVESLVASAGEKVAQMRTIEHYFAKKNSGARRSTRTPYARLLDKLAAVGLKRQEGDSDGAGAGAGEIPWPRTCRFIRICESALQAFVLCHRLFFVDPFAEDQTPLVLSQMGIVKYPMETSDVFRRTPVVLVGDEELESPPKVDVSAPIFRSRREYDEYEDAVMELDQIYRTSEMDPRKIPELRMQCLIQKAGEVLESAPKVVDFSPLQRRRSVYYVYAKILFFLVQALEAKRDYQKSVEHLELITSCQFSGRKLRGNAYVRRVIDLKHLKRNRMAFDVCDEALVGGDLASRHQLALERHIAQLYSVCRIWKKRHTFKYFNKLRKPSERRVPGRVFSTGQKTGKTLYLQTLEDDESEGEADILEVVPIYVEQVALNHYNESQWMGFHCEGSCFGFLFLLLFYDLIYSTNVPSVWQSRFQTAPLDFRQGSLFYEARREAIETRLRLIEDEQRFDELVEMIRATHQDHQGETCVGAAWEAFPLEVMIQIFRCLGPTVASIVCRRLAEDYRANRSGLPDLFLYKPAERLAMFSEVKGPSDRLRDHQMVWIDILLSQGARVEVCHVFHV